MDTLNQIQQSLTSNVTSNVTSSVTDQINNLLGMFIIPSLVITVIILALYIARMVHRHKVDKAIFEIRDMIREMKTTQLLEKAPREADEINNENNPPSQN